MTELGGTLEGVGLPAIVRFLAGLKKSGCLRLAEGDWHGEIFFDNGQISEASLGSRTGLEALDALVEVFPGAAFAFDSRAQLRGEPSIRLNAEALQVHLDEMWRRLQQGVRNLPAAESVPVPVVQEALDGGSEEPLPLDRGTLQTLLAIDGQRSVREVVAQRGSFDVLWQIGNLVEVGLVELRGGTGGVDALAAVRVPAHSRSSVAVATPAPSSPAEPAAAPQPAPAFAPAPAAGPPLVLEPTLRPSLVPAPPATPQFVPAPAAAPSALVVEPTPEPAFGHAPDAQVGRCPKLGFEDDASHAFGRPTRLHRCFAAATPLPLSLDQQRELCLSEFAMCPRLTAASSSSPTPKSAFGRPRPAVPSRDNRDPEPETEPDDPRIVRLPFAARATASAVRNGASDAAAVRNSASGAATAEPTRLRATPRDASRDATTDRPKPLRARLDQVRRPAPVGGASPVDRAGAVTPAPSAADTESAPAHIQARAVAGRALSDAPGAQPSTRLPIPVIGGFVVILVAVAAAAYFLVPQLAPLLADDSVDPAALPNTSRVAAGTPVSALTSSRLTPAAAARGATPAAVARGATPTVAGPDPAIPPSEADPAAAGSVTAPAASGVDSATAPAATASAAPGPAAAPVAAPRTLLDEHFASNDANWPNGPQGPATVTNGTYRVATRQAGKFVAIGAPIIDLPADVVVSVSFRKLAGPAGGGYGIIVRDQGPGARDGSSQDGRYYVLEAGDKGEIGIWRRDGDHWVDLLPWQHSDAVKTGTEANELTARVVGSTLSLLVNGTQVATRTDSTLTAGGAGIFVGGDGNQVAVDHFTIQTP